MLTDPAEKALAKSVSEKVHAQKFVEAARQLSDPENTAVKVLGPSEDHLEANLFSHLVDLHRCASLPMPGEVGELFIGMDRRNQTASIKGTVIPIGKVKKAGRLQGTKRKARS